MNPGAVPRLEILLVEDNEDHAHFIRRSLDNGKYTITRLKDGKEAFNYLVDPPTPPQVVLLDYYLPSMDGMEILRKTASAGKDYAFIFLTVDNSVYTAVEAMKAGAMDFLPKTAQFYEGLPLMIEKVHSLHRARLEKKYLEEQIKKSLKEKELLLREIHHRVKNNLSIIYSLLHFQEQYASGQSAAALLENTRNRIRSMALVHEKLYKARDLTHIYFPEYCNDLVSHLLHTLQPQSAKNGNGTVTYVNEVADIRMDIDTIIPLGLIINELVTNALIHGFAGGNDGGGGSGAIKAEIRLHLQYDKTRERCSLSVADNGRGLPENFDWNQSETLGMFIIRSLVEQINGTLEVRRLKPGGTEFRLDFQIDQRPWKNKGKG